MNKAVQVPVRPNADLDTQITKLAARYRKASGPGMQVITLLGGQAENLLERLPDPVKNSLEEATEKALTVAAKAALGSRAVIKDQPGWLNTAMSTAMGAAGGFGGLPTALAELPITTTVLLRAIQGVAVDYGFDPSIPEVQAACIQVFASAGPLERDDGANTGFFAARVTLSGPAVNSVIARVAPKLATALGQKLAAQTVPVIGAIAGAATNYAYTAYYQEMAHVHFGLLQAERDSGVPQSQLTEMLRAQLTTPLI